MAVSYTHLDVYKRQHYGSSSTGLFNILSIGTNVIIEQSLFNGRGNTLTVLLRDNNYRAVSYTHLDVYKRQM